MLSDTGNLAAGVGDLLPNFAAAGCGDGMDLVPWATSGGRDASGTRLCGLGDRAGTGE